MPLILCIETATDSCSVCVADEQHVIAVKESHHSRSHASQLSVFIDELLKENKLQYASLDAIAVSCGPGSYTGLRIGAATAKGLCFALEKPLIAVHTLESMAHLYKNNAAGNADYFCPMLDARRMEVYTALFNNQVEYVRPAEAVILEENFLADYLQQNKISFFGSGSIKFRNICKSENAVFVDNFNLSATGLVNLALQKYGQKQFEDIAYFEPFYLKDFAGIKK